MKNNNLVSRRTFLKQAGVAGATLTIGLYRSSEAKTTGTIYHSNVQHETSTELMGWISIDSNGDIVLYTHRSEMGQGTWQSIPQIIAEELEVEIHAISVRFAAANPAKYGPQPMDGSFSIRGWAQQLLKVGATAREMLIAAAAQEWKVEKELCFAEKGIVRLRGSDKYLSYGELVKAASELTPPAEVKLKERKDYKIIGKSIARSDTVMKVNGTAKFGLDTKIPGMLYAMVERNPRIKGKVRSYDDSALKNMLGVKRILVVHRFVFGVRCEGVAVVADSLWVAMQGRKLLKIVWDDEGFEHLDSETLFGRMKQDVESLPPSKEFDEALKESSATISSEYEMPYQSHSCMEPLNCIADVREEQIEVWGPIQEVNWIQADLSERFNLPLDKVRVNMTFLGGGFGRKAFPDYPYEAALISKEMKSPVQVMWSREDDMTAGPFRPGARYKCSGGIDSNNKIHSFQILSGLQMMGPGEEKDPVPQEPSVNSGNIAGLFTDYYQTVPHFSFGVVPTKSPIPMMWWRAPGANLDTFAAECFVDELAHLASQDPLAFRRSHMVSPRYIALIDQLEKFSDWKARKRSDGWGVATSDSFGGKVGQVVKVSRKNNKVTIDKVFVVIDCGWYVNPDIIRAQVEGAIVMALGATIKHATHFKDGIAVEKNFNTYAMPRINDIPEIVVHIMENNEPAGGVGEPPLPAFAPALCNAIFDLTGKRIRTLPFNPADV